MATVTVLSEGADNADLINTANWVSPTITWGAAEAGLLCYANRAGAGNPPTPTITGGWSSWSIKVNQAVGTVSGIVVAIGTGTKTDQAITVDHNDDVSSVSRVWAIAGLTDVPTDPWGLFSSGNGTAVTSGTATLAGTPTAGSLLCVWFNVNFDASQAADSPWSEVASPVATTPVLNAALLTNTVLDQTYATSWTTSGGYGWVIFEILHEGVAGLPPKGLIVRPPAIRSTW